MNKAEAARFLDWMSKLYPGAEFTIEQEEIDAIKAAIACLREPAGWVRTSERLPTEADANKNLCVLAMVARDRQIRVARYKELYAKEFDGAYYFSHWMTLPEVEG
jgi:hypothetical protein